jgi:Txe/YoeB family toxin of Txe-Axe toxin-antitoxin module
MEIIIRPKAEKFILKSDKELKQKIKEEIRNIFHEPYQNPKLKNPLSPMRTHHFFHKKSQYRIAYMVENNMVVILIGTRENFYRRIS